MSHKVLVKTALRRREVFKNLAEHLENIKKTVCEIDSNAEIFMFGSVAEEKYNYSSDIDILIVTKVQPAMVHLKLWKAGIKDPFEVHVHSPEKAALSKKRAKFIKV